MARLDRFACINHDKHMAVVRYGVILEEIIFAFYQHTLAFYKDCSKEGTQHRAFMEKYENLFLNYL